MADSFYITNRQKLLFVAEELHKRGFGKLRIIPSLSPSGMNWRCNFIDDTNKNSFYASEWINTHENENSSDEIKLTINEFADLFILENFDFIEHCKGINEDYVKWYSEMLRQLKKDELPYAFADSEMLKGVWRTSQGNEIKTLPNQDKYYFRS